MWAAIEWVPKKNSDTIEYSTVHVSDFADPKYKNGDISTLKTGIEYSVRYNGIKYKGKLCLTGMMLYYNHLIRKFNDCVFFLNFNLLIRYYESM